MSTPSLADWLPPSEQRRGLIPSPAEDELFERAAGAGAEFFGAEVFGQDFGVAGIADGDGGDRLEALGDFELFARLTGTVSSSTAI